MRANDVLPIMFSIIKRAGAAMNTRTPASHAKLGWRWAIATVAGFVVGGLRQRTRVTHIVKVLDDSVHEDSHFPDFALWRRVQVMWMAPPPWDKAPHQNEVFGFDVELQGGKVIELDNITALQKHFKDAGGIAAFQERVKKVLGISV